MEYRRGTRLSVHHELEVRPRRRQSLRHPDVHLGSEERLMPSLRGRNVRFVAGILAVAFSFLAADITHSAFSSTTANPANSLASEASSSGWSCGTPSSPVWFTGMEHGVGFISGGGIFNNSIQLSGTNF